MPCCRFAVGLRNDWLANRRAPKHIPGLLRRVDQFALIGTIVLGHSPSCL